MITCLRARAFTFGLLAAASLFASACSDPQQIGGGSGGGGGTGASTCTTSTATPRPTEDCEPTSSSTLPGVHIEITSAACTLSLSDPGPGLVFTYEVVVDEDIAGVAPERQDAGGCGQPGSSGLVLFEQVAGGTQRYCLCDVGICQAEPLPAVTLKKGTYPGSFSWSGRNWNGPSDTVEPLGPPFAAGDYAFTVNARGKLSTAGGDVPFEVEAKLPVHVVP